MELRNKFRCKNFNYAVTFLGGQTFAWQPISMDKKIFLGISDFNATVVKVTHNYIYWQTYPQKDDIQFINRYFNITANCKQYDKILQQISIDPYVNQAIKNVPGIRMLKQPIYFTIFTFIISSNNRIKRIRKSVKLLSKLYGESIYIPGLGNINLFPTLEKLSKLTESDLQKTGVGFRAKYMKETANKLIRNKLLSNLEYMSNNDAFLKLQELPGIGPKISDCVLAFALSRDVIPIDTWIKKMLINIYKLPDNWKYPQYKEWMNKHFKNYALYAGQFLYEWYRNYKIS